MSVVAHLTTTVRYEVRDNTVDVYVEVNCTPSGDGKTTVTSWLYDLPNLGETAQEIRENMEACGRSRQASVTELLRSVGVEVRKWRAVSVSERKRKMW